MDTKKLFKHIPWVILGIIGAFCLSVVALRRGEHVSALWIVVASVSVYLVAYRYYSLYIAQKVMKLDPTRSTPAVINNDGLNYVPTNRYVLFGHHFAAIAGAGPLVGPVLAAQMGYLPGTLWLLAGVVLAGAVQDFMVLFISSRRNGASLGEMIKQEMGPVPGSIALFGCFLIMIHPRGAGAHRGESAGGKPVGRLYRLLDGTYCPVYGDLHALPAPWPRG